MMNKACIEKSSLFFIFALLLISFCLISLAMLLIKINIPPTLVTTGCYFIFFSCTIFLGKYMRFQPLLHWGYHRQALYISFIMTFFVITFMTVCKWLVIQNTSLSLFAPSIVTYDGNQLPNQKKFLFCIFYILLSIPMQEIIFRAYVQPMFQNIITKLRDNHTHVFAWSNLLTNIFFASIHLVRDTWLAFYCFFLGSMWGWAYYKYKSLPYIILSHVIIAVWAFFILDIRGVFLMRY